MTVSILDLHCLNAVCDDYESLDSICEEVRRSSHGNVNRDEVADAILERLKTSRVDGAIPATLEDDLMGMLPEDSDKEARDAVRRAARNTLAIVTGGPGTGKTFSLTRLLAVLLRQRRRWWQGQRRGSAAFGNWERR